MEIQTSGALMPDAGNLENSPITREALYELVWSEPMLKVGKRFDVSSSYMARVCTQLRVPRPERGYWAKLAVGQAPKKPPLPEAMPGGELVWARNGEQHIYSRPRPTLPAAPRMSPPATKRQLPAIHPLIVGVKPLFAAGRLSWDIGYLKPAKRLLPDLAVTQTGLDSALNLANQLFLGLEGDGHRVVIAPQGEHSRRAEFDVYDPPGKRHVFNNLWSPQRSTVVYIGTVPIGLTIIEMAEEVEARYVNGKYIRLTDYVAPRRGRYAVESGWTSKHSFPTGRLLLQAYSPRSALEWKMQWRESPDRPLIDRIPSIIKELKRAVPELINLIEEAERQAELEHQKWEAQRAQWRREEEIRRTAQALKDSTAELHGIIGTWSETKRLEAFFLDAEQRMAALPEGEREPALERLHKARELIGSVDALALLRRWKTPQERYP